MIRNFCCFAAAMAAAMLIAVPANASTFRTITIDGDYSDWIGVPVLDSDGGDNFSGPDIGDTQIANDGQFLYIRNTFPNGLSLGTFTSIDVDNDPTTGFDIFGLGLIGADVSWQNDFPFTQSTGVFNDGHGMSGDFFGSGAALIAFDGVGFINHTDREMAISLDITRNIDGSPVFGGPGSTVTLLFWTDLGTGADGLPAGFPGDDGLNFDVSAVITYTLAIPEPTSLSLGMLAAFGLLVRRRGTI